MLLIMLTFFSVPIPNKISQGSKKHEETRNQIGTVPFLARLEKDHRPIAPMIVVAIVEISKRRYVTDKFD